jgi:hypothetical protein
MLSPLFKVKEYGIIDSNPYGIEVVYSLPKQDSEGRTKRAKLLFEKGCNIPLVKSLSFEGRKEVLDIQLKYSDKETNLPDGSPILLGNYRITPPPHEHETFTLVIKIKLDQNLIAFVNSAELVEDYIVQEKIPIVNTNKKVTNIEF